LGFALVGVSENIGVGVFVLIVRFIPFGHFLLNLPKRKRFFSYYLRKRFK
jgi:hypothetical protein